MHVSFFNSIFWCGFDGKKTITFGDVWTLFLSRLIVIFFSPKKKLSNCLFVLFFIFIISNGSGQKFFLRYFRLFGRFRLSSTKMMQKTIFYFLLFFCGCLFWWEKNSWIKSFRFGCWMAVLF